MGGKGVGYHHHHHLEPPPPFASLPPIHPATSFSSIGPDQSYHCAAVKYVPVTNHMRTLIRFYGYLKIKFHCDSSEGLIVSYKIE